MPDISDIFELFLTLYSESNFGVTFTPPGPRRPSGVKAG